MRASSSALRDHEPELLARLPAGVERDALARETKAIQRRREVVDGAGLLRIALARGPGGLSLRGIAAWASLRGIAELSTPGVTDRLNQASGFLAALVERLLAAQASGAELRWPGRILRLADGSCVSQPGSAGTDWRIHGVFALGGGVSPLELTDPQGGEALLRGAPLAGEIRIGDRTSARASVLRRFRAESGGRADVIVRRYRAAPARPADRAAQDARGHRSQPSGVAPCRDAERQDARPPQPGRRGVHDAGDLAAPARLQRAGHARRRPPAMADRARVQAPEVAAADRPAADPHRARIAELALRTPHPGPARRRPEPASPASFPPRTCSAPTTRPLSGPCRRPSSCSSSASAPCRSPPSSAQETRGIAPSPTLRHTEHLSSALRCRDHLCAHGGAGGGAATRLSFLPFGLYSRPNHAEAPP